MLVEGAEEMRKSAGPPKLCNLSTANKAQRPAVKRLDLIKHAPGLYFSNPLDGVLLYKFHNICKLESPSLRFRPGLWTKSGLRSLRVARAYLAALGDGI